MSSCGTGLVTFILQLQVEATKVMFCLVTLLTSTLINITSFDTSPFWFFYHLCKLCSPQIPPFPYHHQFVFFKLLTILASAFFEKKMKDFPGTPGTVLGLILRMSQFIFAALSIGYMVTTTSFMDITAFCYLIAAMGLQAIWSFLLALMDAYAVVRKKVLHNPVLVSLYLVGDWVSATLSLAAACSSAGITVLYFHDLRHCYFGEKCRSYQISVGCAFLSWIPTSISSLIMLWLLAAG